MAYNKFRIHVTLQVLLLGVTVFIVLYLYVRTDFVATLFLIGAVIVFQIVYLIRYVETTNRELNRFLNAMKHEDYSTSFAGLKIGPSFDQLHKTFSDFTQQFIQVRSEKEENYRFLQTVVQHVGTGVISFEPGGEIALMNAAAKRLLHIGDVKNIKKLNNDEHRIGDTLLRLRAGETMLIPSTFDSTRQTLAAYATEYKLGEKKYTLVSLQNIQNELDRERMAKELEIARTIQKSLLPDQNPRVPGYRISGVCIPAKEVGGDYYDFIHLPDGKLALIIADVSGKGIPSAFYMTLTKGMIQSQILYTGSPKEILIRVNNLLYNTIAEKFFVTMFFAVLDPEKRTLVCTRAGHNSAIHYQCETTHVSHIRPDGIGLGLERGEVFEKNLQEQTLHLKRGDVVVFYTDGFTEAYNNDRVEYGEKKLMDLIQLNASVDPDELIQKITDDVTSFTGANHRHDDMTMIAIKVTD